jgi:serine/threonine-protein kinase
VGYYMLTGEHVFEGNTLVEVCGHHLHSAPEPPSRRLGTPVPADLEAVLLDCLAKDPADRPRDAAAFRERLGRCEAFGEWDGLRARRWWSENAARLRERRTRSTDPGDIPAAGPAAGSLLSVDVGERGL